MDSIERYFRELRDIRNSGEGVNETSFYPALATLLNDVGKLLRPRVKAILPIRNRGAGMPDGGFFTPDQLRRRSDEEIAVAVPSRGALEAKHPGHDLDTLAASEQVGRYLDRYRQVLLTNYREFLLVAMDRGQARQFERLSLTPDEPTFWSLLQDPHALAATHGAPLIEYLQRAMTRQAQIATPEDLSWLLASYAREANFRIATVELPALLSLRTSLESALGIRFEGPKGEHFFRSTLIQTLFYGIFSAWVLWVRSESSHRSRFNWREAAWHLQVPLMRALFEQVSMPGRLLPLRLVELLDWTAESLDRVDVPSFFSRFGESEAVQYFYEPFLRNFDPELRRQLGVWYTPPEVVKYMVARVDEALRKDLGIANGLADDSVFVLDPACGTGAFLIEVLRKIESTLRLGNDDALVADDIREAASGRLFGFELLPAPFVIAHLQIGLLLQQLGAGGSSDHDAHRAGVFLTNSLTGWAPATESAKQRLNQLTLAFPELRDEHDSAERVKQESPILVIIGNPPYNGFAGVSPEEEQDLVQPYKDGLAQWGITKNYLDDLYVRFYRVAERKIAEMNGKGIIAYISNFSFLSQPSFVIMRERLSREFNSVTIDSLNGDSRITGKRTPDGQPDPSVFSTEYNREGIQVGTAVCVLVKTGKSDTSHRVRYRDFWGVNKRAELLDSLSRPSRHPYQDLTPTRENSFAFVPRREAACFNAWPDVTELAGAHPSLGLNENRRQALIDTDREELARRMSDYLNPAVTDEQIRDAGSGLMMKAARFDPQMVRERLLRGVGFDEAKIRRFTFRPFDFRWAYIETMGKLWNEVRRELVEQIVEGSQQFLYVRCHAPRAADGTPTYFNASVGDQHALHKDAYLIPFFASQRTSDQQRLFEGVATDSVRSTQVANISHRSRRYLASIGADDDRDGVLIWYHVLAVTYSPRYVAENADAIRFGWPRIPLPCSEELLRSSAALGKRIANLLESDEPLADPYIRLGAITSARSDGSLRLDDGDLAVSAGWGYVSNGATMPGSGKLRERPYAGEETEMLALATSRIGETSAAVKSVLGESTVDVYLNDHAYWRNVPVGVWNYTIGGYQVLKKWLSYREEPVLRRSLRKEEARSFGNIAVRLGTLLLSERELDANYEECSKETWAWADADTSVPEA